MELGEKYFDTNRFPTLQKVHADAIGYLKSSKDTFDLVVVDIFVDNKVPPEFQTEDFAKLVKKVCAEKSVMIFNKMIQNQEMQNEMNTTEAVFRKIFPQVEVVKTSSYGVENNMLWCDTLQK